MWMTVWEQTIHQPAREQTCPQAQALVPTPLYCRTIQFSGLRKLQVRVREREMERKRVLQLELMKPGLGRSSPPWHRRRMAPVWEQRRDQQYRGPAMWRSRQVLLPMKSQVQVQRQRLERAALHRSLSHQM